MVIRFIVLVMFIGFCGSEVLAESAFEMAKRPVSSQTDRDSLSAGVINAYMKEIISACDALQKELAASPKPSAERVKAIREAKAAMYKDVRLFIEEIDDANFIAQTAKDAAAKFKKFWTSSSGWPTAE